MYQEAEKKRVERDNWMAWMQGMYIYEALCDASPIFRDFGKKGTKAVPFRNEPYKLFKDDEEQDKKCKEKQEENDRLRAQLYMQQMVRAGRNWGKGAK